ncbi:NAD(P)/FAD-dependent oxidoreductase [Alsobacter sp. KACC 23698]|uniref:NADH:ubiquinone reductase (non-electrogenic) n=1 Tax=Alsobacter sp. KACC 23698 TaxID=3149229 RepID=A0AAU7JDZ7_9HYPH
MHTVSSRRRVVIVGGGFGGLSAAQALARAPVDVTLIDRHNYHLFQPLLYQVATAGLSPADIASPIRGVLHRQKNAFVMLARVTGVDPDRRVVMTDEGDVAYDALIIATGAKHAYFGRDGWERHAPGLKKIEDATELRRRILLAFEKAEIVKDPAERRRLLTFAVIGGGPTGVEMAGAIAELARTALAADFRAIDPRMTRVVLIEAGPRILPSFHPQSSATAAAGLRGLGVEVEAGAPVTAVDGEGVEVAGRRIESRTIVWAAGVRASPAARWLGAEADGAGRVKVAADLSVPGRPNIFVIGDAAHVAGPDGRPLPGVAPVAKQQGRHAARQIGLAPELRAPFRYRDYGAMATIGRRKAVADLGRVRLSGSLAWLIWCVAHVYFLIGFRNRMSVAANWAWSYVTYQRGPRLITGSGEEHPLAPEQAPAAALRRSA